MLVSLWQIIRPDRMERLPEYDCHCHILPGMDDGAVFQRNLGSLQGFYGEPAMERAKYLYDEGYYSFLGTDLHNRRYADFFNTL